MPLGVQSEDHDLSHGVPQISLFRREDWVPQVSCFRRGDFDVPLTLYSNGRLPHPSRAFCERVGSSTSSVLLCGLCGKGSARLVGVFTVILVSLLTACKHHSSQPASKRYSFKGRVVSIDSQAQSATIDGEAIPGFMDAMAMSYKIKPPAALSQLAPGDSIAAEVVVFESKSDAPADYWLENVKVTAHAPTLPASSLHMPSPGEDLPDFFLTNQSGKRISLHQYRGKVLLVTFIYTRCPFPDVCPRMSSRFAEIYDQFGSNPSLADIHLLSVSFDSERDTPKVLREYAFSVAHTRNPALFTRWEFAVPRPSDLSKVAGFFALTITPAGGLITHSLSTAVIGPDGKIASWYHGSDWRVSDLVKDATAAQAHKTAALTLTYSREAAFGWRSA